MTTETETHPAPRVLRAILAAPWAILPPALEQLVEIAGRHGDLEALAAKRGQPLEGTGDVSVRDGVAVLPVTGPIFPRANLFTEISGATSVEMLALDFQAALEDRTVSGIVLNIDSPGGQVSGIQEFAAMVAGARGVKPVAAYVRDTGASAAYWIAAAAERLVISKTAVVGSIGVVASFARRGGDTLEIVSSQSPKKRMDPASNEGQAEVLRTLDDLAAVFVSDVAAYRGTTARDVEQNFGQGGVLVGARAVAAGMADGLGTLESVVAELSAGRLLAGNRNALEGTMPDAKKPEAGGGPADVRPEASPLPAGAPADDDRRPSAEDVLALAAVLLGTEAAETLNRAMADARTAGVDCRTYATLAGKFAQAGVARPAAESPRPGNPAAVAAITKALAAPSAPGVVTEAGTAEREAMRAHIRAGGESRYGRRR